MHVEFDWQVISLIFISTLVAYTFPLFLKLERHESLWKISSIAYLGLAMIGFYLLLHSQSVQALYIIALLCFSTLFYYLPLGKVGSFREIPFVKVFLISLMWTLATVPFPLSYDGFSIFGTDVLLLMIERFLFVLAITIPFDVRDTKVDRKGGLVTLPVFIGWQNALFLSVFILILYLIVTICHYGFGNIAFARMICVFAVLILIQKINFTRSSYYYTGLLDGTMTFQSLLLYVIV